MKKIKICFDINGSDKWIGGIYYLKNIIFQMYSNEKIKNVFKAIIVCDKKYKNQFESILSDLNLFVYDKKSRIHRLMIMLMATKLCDHIYYYHKYKFDFLNLLEKKAIYWIPDFQECYYPQYFTQDELEKRHRQREMIARSTRPVVLSSKSAKNDFIKFFHPTNKYIYVVPFVSAIENEVVKLTDDFCFEVLKKYKLNNMKFVLISNQFWQHKNHIVVFEAIAKAKSSVLFKDLTYVFTGELKDYRNTEYYNKLKKIIHDNDIEKQIKILGFIDRADQLALMHKAQLIIQPSLFEGWGTVVEDAKVLDKTIVLSDIPVHREQMNDKCLLFDANDPQDLIEVLNSALEDLQEDNVEKGIARMKDDAKRYSENLLKLINDMEKRKC